MAARVDADGAADGYGHMRTTLAATRGAQDCSSVAAPGAFMESASTKMYFRPVVIVCHASIWANCMPVNLAIAEYVSTAAFVPTSAVPSVGDRSMPQRCGALP